MVQAFEKTVKYRFRHEAQAELLTFGSANDNERKSGIRKGQLKLEGCVPPSSCGGMNTYSQSNIFSGVIFPRSSMLLFSV